MSALLLSLFLLWAKTELFTISRQGQDKLNDISCVTLSLSLFSSFFIVAYRIVSYSSSSYPIIRYDAIWCIKLSLIKQRSDYAAKWNGKGRKASLSIFNSTVCSLSIVDCLCPLSFVGIMTSIKRKKRHKFTLTMTINFFPLFFIPYRFSFSFSFCSSFLIPHLISFWYRYSIPYFTAFFPIRSKISQEPIESP